MTNATKRLEIESTLQAFRAAGAERGVYYLSTPITTGLREVELMDRLGVTTQSDLHTQYRTQWLDGVVRPNERDAMLQADLVTETIALGLLVINPARVSHSHWEQPDYDQLWNRLLDEFPVTLVPVPGWEFSRGSRLEVAHALSLGVPILDGSGSPLSAADLRLAAEAADQTLRANGWKHLADSLPPIPDPGRSSDGPSGADRTPRTRYSRSARSTGWCENATISCTSLGRRSTTSAPSSTASRRAAGGTTN